jgi:hypothetical protein
MPRRIIIPPADCKLLEIEGGWAVYRHPPTAADSPLWVCLKTIHVPAVTRRHRRGTNRVFWLYWGIDEGRFRRSKHSRAFEAQQPAVFEATVRRLAELLTPGDVLRQLGEGGLEAERRRLANSRAVHQEHDRRRAAEAAARGAAPKTLDDLM